MRTISRLTIAGAVALLLTGPSTRPATVQAQGQAPAPPAGQTQQPTFRVTTDLISTDVIVRDRKGQFVADLDASDFEVLEDGVKQEVVSFFLSHGGRTYNQQTVQAPAAAPQEGILLPPSRPTNDASGRIFIIFIDDLHLDFRSTPRTRDLLKRMLKTLIHDGDMFGIVSTGTSSISQQLTYDRQILEHAINRVTGGALKPSEILSASWGAQGPLEVRHRAHVAFETAHELVKNLERVQNRRKAVIYLSSGYDFNPFERTHFDQQVERLNTTAEQLAFDPFQMAARSQQTLNEADLIAEMTFLTRAANRANASFYTIDPRGLVAGQDVDEEINYQDWLEHVNETQITLRVLAEETGGFAIVNQNDFDKGLKRIDAETSDYYLLGYYSNNPDPLKRNRRLTVRVVGREDLEVQHRQAYSLRPVAAPR
jgi:VWFA-related protein